MKVTEKCDVYAFGVLTLEIIAGHHPADLMCSTSISSLSSSPSSTNSSSLQSITQNTLLKDLLDKRLHNPNPEVVEEIFNIMKLAFKCIDNNPMLRPTMQHVSQELSTERHTLSSKLEDVTLGQLLNLEVCQEENAGFPA